MRFLIYIPGDAVGNDQNLAKVGLPHLVAGSASIVVSTGPDGGRGSVFSWPAGSVPPLGYMPDKQDWIEAVQSGDLPAGRYWVGFTKGNYPQPHELAWKSRFEGHFVKLGDGNEWCIPAAGMLPQVLRKDRDGRTRYEIRDQFRDFFEESGVWMLKLATYDPQSLSVLVDASVFEFIERALSLNYRITTEVISHLGLLGTDTLKACLFAIFDGVGFVDPEADQKKTESTSGI